MGEVIRQPLPSAEPAEPYGLAAPLCPVDRLPRRRRNKLCISILVLGGLNLLAYTLLYAALGGDAHNGHSAVVTRGDGSRATVYYLGGHYIRSVEGIERPVTRGVWIYSYLHSISVLLTSGAMIISMLILARADIIATMRDGWISGPTLVTVFGTIVVLGTGAATFLFIWDFIAQLSAPGGG
ncbi:MAG: hypothetical protein CHACPFDD_01060 [Phycisphaerae bacterium]|nr:hypothetical protein [Phycisphaerae bacterium]